jgi:hypothetical protein
MIPFGDSPSHRRSSDWRAKKRNADIIRPTSLLRECGEQSGGADGRLLTSSETQSDVPFSGKRLISKGSKERGCVEICLSGGREERASASLRNHNTSVHPSCVSVSLQPKAPSMTIVCWTKAMRTSASASRVVLRGTWPTNCFEVLPWPSLDRPGLVS